MTLLTTEPARLAILTYICFLPLRLKDRPWTKVQGQVNECDKLCQCAVTATPLVATTLRPQRTSNIPSRPSTRKKPVRDLASDAHRVVETHQTDRVPGETRREKLEGHRMPQLEVVGPEDLTHATLAEQADDAVAVSQDSSWNKASLFRDVRQRRVPFATVFGRPSRGFVGGHREEPGSLARYTSPIPPFPRGERISKTPRRVPAARGIALD